MMSPAHPGGNMRLTAIISACIMASGCAYQAQTSSTPANDTVTGYSRKIPGRWLIYSNADALNADTRLDTLSCAAHKFPVILGSGFHGSVIGTMANIVEAFDPTQSPSGTGSARGLIAVRGERVESRLRVNEGLWTGSFAAEITLSASVTVDGKSGRLFGKTIEASGRADGPIGFMCAGGELVVRNAAETAQKNLLRKIGEEVGNSDRVRAYR
jgi:hypothetical protein